MSIVAVSNAVYPVPNTSLKGLNHLRYQLTSTQVLLQQDLVIVEEPLQISLSWFNAKQNDYQTDILTIVMRTPGDDDLLIMGLLFAEGIIALKTDILSISKVDDTEHSDNHIEVTLAQHVQPNWQQISRTFTSQSSCGLCGKTSLQALALSQQTNIDQQASWLSPANICQWAQELKNHQNLFEQSGGVHGAAFLAEQKWLSCFEDVGRHNAVDKLVGDILKRDLFSPQGVLLLSGRVSFELMQKAIKAAIPVVIALGAPSSLAILAAQQFNISLIGFTKAQQFNVYHGDFRLNRAKDLSNKL